jgi:hypothetical protein
MKKSKARHGGLYFFARCVPGASRSPRLAAGEETSRFLHTRPIFFIGPCSGKLQLATSKTPQAGACRYTAGRLLRTNFLRKGLE